MERPGLPGPADATDPGRINVRVGGDEEEEAELFAALSREHGERERERAERPRPRGGERRRPGGQGGGEQATERRAVAPLLFGQQGAAAPRADASVAPDRKKSGLWTETGEAQAEAAPWAQHANAERAGERVATASAGWAREETRARGGAVPRRGRANEDPALQQMRDELRTLRTLFENQLSMLEWGRMGHRHPARAAVIKRLAELGLGADVSRRLADHIGSDDPPDSAFRKALALIARNLPVAGDEIVERGGVVALVGPTGVGKTTTVAKLAARYALRHGREKVALVSTDNYRVGAQDQLLTYARILDVPVYTATNRHELRNVVDDLSGRGLVLIDTVGMSQRDVRLAEQFKTLGSGEGLVRTFLVLSAATQLSTLTESVSAFSGAAPVGCILTKVDEATTLGGALTCALRTRLPLAYLTTGQRVPEDLQAARGDILVHRACALLDEHKQEPDEETLALSLGGGAHVSE
ncbi:flagellar biosynthesis protein FlhF [Halorhodospira abdelmalekii]|nr:flagellar biosynthesis protein FlhF [Halorhodospira abdelmalekii]